jgi:hypothetical protein
MGVATPHDPGAYTYVLRPHALADSNPAHVIWLGTFMCVPYTLSVYMGRFIENFAMAAA